MQRLPFDPKASAACLFVAFLVAFSAVGGTGKSRSGIFPKDCIVCGYVCCCPEACAAKLVESLKRSGSYCSTSSHSQHSETAHDGAGISCGVSENDSHSNSLLQEKTLLPSLRARLIKRQSPNRSEESRPICGRDHLVSPLSIPAIDTPPPRFSV
jgi:hypothetical protein